MPDTLDRRTVVTGIVCVVIGIALGVFVCRIASTRSPSGTGQVATLLRAALESENYRSAESILASGHSPNATDAEGLTALTTAILKEDTRAVQWLLAHGADPNQKRLIPVDGLESPLFDTPLQLAIDAGCDPCVSLLLDHHAEVGVGTSSGFQAFHRAARRCASDLVLEALRAHGASLAAVDRLGRTPLHYAACPAFVDYACANGADPNAQDTLGNTPLHLKVLGRSDVVRRLLECGARTDLKDRNGLTPIDRLSRFLRQTPARPPGDELLENMLILESLRDVSREGT